MRDTVYSLEVERFRQSVRVRLSGEVDVAVVPQVESQLKTLLYSMSSVVLDCEQVQFIDVAGMRMLHALESYARDLNTPFVVTGWNDALRRVLPAFAPAASETTVDFGRIALVAHALTAAIDIEEVLNIVVMQGLAGLAADGAVITWLTDAGLEWAVTMGYDPDAVAAFSPMTLDQELPLTIAAREREAVWVPTRRDATERFPLLGTSPAIVSNAWAAVPLVSQGEVFGVLGLSFRSEHEWSRDERTYVSALGDLCALAVACRSRPADV